MNIGSAAKASGVNVKLIRHYESIGMIPKAVRSESGYRVYCDTDVSILGFIKRGRSFGFSMKDIKKLVGLWRDRSQACEEVNSLALEHVKVLEEKIEELQAMVNTLKDLAKSCGGSRKSECPIIERLVECTAQAAGSQEYPTPVSAF